MSHSIIQIPKPICDKLVKIDNTKPKTQIFRQNYAIISGFAITLQKGQSWTSFSIYMGLCQVQWASQMKTPVPIY